MQNLLFPYYYYKLDQTESIHIEDVQAVVKGETQVIDVTVS